MFLGCDNVFFLEMTGNVTFGLKMFRKCLNRANLLGRFLFGSQVCGPDPWCGSALPGGSLGTLAEGATGPTSFGGPE